MSKQPPLPTTDDDDQAVGFEGMCDFFDVSGPSGWRMVNEGRVPPPFYPRPRKPKWTLGELREAREKMRMLPREAKAANRAKKLQAAQVVGERPATTDPPAAAIKPKGSTAKRKRRNARAFRAAESAAEEAAQLGSDRVPPATP